MDSRLQSQLEEAKLRFHDWQLLEAYHILRRFYDRLPFAPEPAHAEYVAIFVQVILELGREQELAFYTSQLEKWCEQEQSPHLAFALGVLYTYGPGATGSGAGARMEAARGLFEKVLKDPSATAYHFRSQLFLARYYDEVKADVAGCRAIIDSLSTPEDPELAFRLEIWRSHLLTMEQRYAEALDGFRTLLGRLTPERSWYCHFSALLALAWLHVQRGDLAAARELVGEMRARLEGRPSKQLGLKLQAVEARLSKRDISGALGIEVDAENVTVSYGNHLIQLRRGSASEVLLSLLMSHPSLDKESIVKALWEEDYQDNRGFDQRIRYQIHALRKRLMALGLPPKVIEFTAGGYRLSPEVERGGDSCL